MLRTQEFETLIHVYGTGGFLNDLVACDIRYVIKKRKIATREPDNNIQREENLRGTVCERERKVMSLTNSF